MLAIVDWVLISVRLSEGKIRLAEKGKPLNCKIMQQNDNWKNLLKKRGAALRLEPRVLSVTAVMVAGGMREEVGRMQRVEN